MKKILLGTAAVMALGLTPAFATEPVVATDAAVAVKAEAAVDAEAVADKAVEVEAAVSVDKAVEAQTVADIAGANAELSTLVAALKAADLTDALKGAGPYTLFAPTNAAFEKLGKEKLADLLKPENKEQLVALLKFHVVPGKIAAVDAKGATVDLTTLSTQAVKVDGKGDAIKIGAATVTKADIMASNGIVHEIDTVIMPVDAPAQH